MSQFNRRRMGHVHGDEGDVETELKTFDQFVALVLVGTRCISSRIRE